MLTVSSPTEGQVWGDITVKTNFELQSWLFGFQASKGQHFIILSAQHTCGSSETSVSIPSTQIELELFKIADAKNTRMLLHFQEQ